MRHHSSQAGLTLIEMLIYIGLIVIILPALGVIMVQLTQRVSLTDVRGRVTALSHVLFSQYATDFTQARAIAVSQSTLGVNGSVLKFTDSTGTLVTIDRVSTSVSFTGGAQTVRRLRMQRGAAAAFWLTDRDLDTRSFIVSVVRDTTGKLTGLRVHQDIALLGAANGPYQNATFVADTTFALEPQTTEN